jgi:hypothetical protein
MRREISFGNMQIRPTDAAHLDADEHLPRRWGRPRQLDKGEGPLLDGPRLEDDHGFHNLLLRRHCAV